MGFASIWHWLVVLLIVVLVFGTGKLKNVGKDLGQAIRDFKDGVNGEDSTREGAKNPAKLEDSARDEIRSSSVMNDRHENGGRAGGVGAKSSSSDDGDADGSVNDSSR